MNTNLLLRVGFLVAAFILIGLDFFLSKRVVKPWIITSAIIVIIAFTYIFFDIFLWYNHINFPLNLDLMEGVIWQHFQRAAAFQPIYIQPTPDFVPLTYNPLFYELAVPFSWIFGVNLFTLRLVSILGMAGSGLILYQVARHETNSRWWGLITVGLFAAAYRVMDAYLDTAHSDSWLLFSVLLGSYIIYRKQSRWWKLAGLMVLISSFWFKQHGALFAVGGVLFLTWRDGVKRSWIYWLVATIFGPLAYIFSGPAIFGPYYHYFSWEVPRRWTEFNFDTVRRYLGFILRSYPVLASSSLLFTAWLGWRDHKRLTIWEFQLIFAMLAGLMGALDPGSSDNVFIPMGAFFILVGTIGLFQFSTGIMAARRFGLYLAGILITFAAFLYNPFTVIVSPQAQQSYQDFVKFLHDLNGNVYAPYLGQIQNGYSLYPAAHWVALEDMVRGPGRIEEDQPITRQMLDPVIDPKKNTYIITNYPIEDMVPAVQFLGQFYVLGEDYGDRFEPLRVLPKRWDHAWPRYLYQYNPN